jgi:transmembrane sensor
MTWIVNEIEDAAAAWDARLRGAKPTFRLKENAEHQAAHDRLQAALGTLRDHADLPELSALRDEARSTVQKSKMRRLVAMMSAAAAIIILLFTIPPTNRGAEIAALLQGERIYSTTPDERTRVTLADGTVVTLDSGTRLAARIGESRRDITMLNGRALFQVAKDHRRPFVVKAGQRTITALGTVFDVRLSPRELRVTLAEGAVAVRPVNSGRGSVPQILKPHQQLVAVTGAAAPALRTIDIDNALSWADQQLFFEDEPLASAIDEINSYSRLKIIVDPDVADMRINGMFRVSNQARFIEALKIALPIEVHPHRDREGHLVVSRRSDRSTDNQEANM